MRTAILHIGTEKTGTTTIQAFLAANRERLVQRGFAYPRSSGEHDSRLLTMYAMRPERCEDLHIHASLTTPATRQDMAARLEHQLAAELAALPDTVRTVVFSSEHCHSRLHHPDELERLRDLLLCHIGRARILVYLRRQDRLAVSLYSTAMQCGETRPKILPEVGDGDSYYHYDVLLDRWARAFGPENVQPRLFCASELVGKDVVADFCAACGLGDLDGLERPPWRNQSLQPAAQEFLRQMNAYFPMFDGEQLHADRGLLSDWIAEAFRGAGRLPSKEMAATFLARFAAANERVRARWFPDRTALFDDDLSAYPEHTGDGLAFEDAVRVAAALWRRSQAEIQGLKARVCHLEAELAFQKGKIALKKGRLDQAEALFRATLDLDPAHPFAPHQLARAAARRCPRANHGKAAIIKCFRSRS